MQGQLLFKERGISGAKWRSGQKTLDMWANCVLKHCLSLKTFIPTFVAFFVSLGIVISCIRKMSFSVTSAKRELTPAIVSLSTSWEMDIQVVHKSELANQSNCLKYQRHRFYLCQIPVMQCFLLGYRGICHALLVFSVYTRIFRRVCINMFRGIPRESIA